MLRSSWSKSPCTLRGDSVDERAASIHAGEQPGWASPVSPTAADGRYPHLPSTKMGRYSPRTFFLLFVEKKTCTKIAIFCNSPSQTNSEQNRTATSAAHECLWHSQHLMSVGWHTWKVCGEVLPPVWCANAMTSLIWGSWILFLKEAVTEDNSSPSLPFGNWLHRQLHSSQMLAFEALCIL